MRKLVVFLCVLGSSLFLNLLYAQSSKGISKITISIGAQNPKSPHGSFLDIKEAKTYYLKDIEQYQQNIDIICSYGDSTKINFLTPNSAALKSIKAYKEKVFEGWKYKNRGAFILLKNDKASKELYEKVETKENLIAAYKKGAELVSQQSGYNKTDQGPSSRIRKIDVDDYVLFRSVDRGIYAIGRVVKIEPGFQGYAVVEFKIAD